MLLGLKQSFFPMRRVVAFLASCFLLAASQTALAAGSPPEAPDNLTGSLIEGLVSLSWDVPADDDTVEGYNVYINNQYSNTVASNSYSLQLDADTLYSFYVVAFDEAPRNFSAASESLTLPESLIPDDLTIPPSVPSELTGDINNGTVSLSWAPSTDDEAVLGYNVYRDNQYFTTVSSPEYSDADNGDESHSWYVVAIDIRTNFSARSERIVLPDPGPVDTTLPPSVPQGLDGTVDAGNTTDNITLSWQASTDDQSVAGYNIYINRQYIATRFGTQYSGTTEAGSSNAFSIVAFDFDGNFSATSEPLTLPLGTEETNPGTPPSIPSALAGDTNTANGETTVQLSWQASTSTVQIAGYNVYRGNDYLTTVFETQYTDVVAAGAAFSYSIAAFDNFGNFSARSTPLSLLGDANQPPFFSDLSDQNIAVGEDWELLLRPVDLDGGAAGIFISEPPAGVEFIDNRNGTRSLTWQPSVDDVGVYEITVTAFDLLDTSLRTSQTITITVTDGDPQPQASFTINIAQSAYNLLEGNAAGVTIPITLSRDGVSELPVSLTVEAVSNSEQAGINASFSATNLTAGDSESILNLQLSISALPILSQQRRFIVSATDGIETQTASVTVAVTPVALDDVYLLIGQSNMVGSSEAGAKQAGPGQLDELNLRIRQANVSRNDTSQFIIADDYTDIDINFSAPTIVTAEDPLHEPVDPSTLSKEGTTIGLGLSFAKTALPNTSRNIVLVPAAWSGTGFCDSSGRLAHWNANATDDNSALGNSLLFDRAIARTNETLRVTGGILRGILWHQGEEDSRAECAAFYENNLTTMAAALRSEIAPDARGAEARGPAANIPFVVGTMSRGADERGDLSDFSEAKTTVDNVHRSIAQTIPFSEVILTDDLTPDNGYPCGVDSCIHFGAAALREMGARAHDALIRAVAN